MLDNVSEYIMFYNLHNYKKIEKITIGNSKYNMGSIFCLFDKKNLLVAKESKILLIDLQKYGIKSKFNLDAKNTPNSLIALNEKDFLIFIEGKDGDYIAQYEINTKKNIIFKYKKKIKYEYYLVGKFNGNKIIIKEDNIYNKRKVLILD